MKKLLVLVLILFTVSIFAQEWYGNKDLINNITEHSSKDSTWENYPGSPYNAVQISEERATYYNANDFGLEYPISLHALTSYFYSAGYNFGFKIYDKDGITILYEKSRMFSIIDYNDHYLATPITLNDDFWVSVVPDADGQPLQVFSDAVETSHSYIGSAGSWETYININSGDKFEHITSILISQYTGVDLYSPSVRNVYGSESYSNLNANVGLTLQDQNLIVSPVIGEYSFDNGVIWNSFNLNSMKGSDSFTGIIPGQVDGTNGIVRFNLEDDQGNTAVSDEYPITWSDDFPLFATSFESDPFSEGWSLITAGAGWKYLKDLGVYPEAPTGEYYMTHYDDVDIQDDWLMTPVFSLPSESNILLSFWETSLWVEYIGTHEVSVTTDGGVSWTQICSTVPEENIFNQVFASLDDFSGQDIQIGWHYIGDYSDHWFIDDIEVFVNIDPPSITKMYANLTVLPIVGQFINEDMVIKLGIYDKTYIKTAVGHYTFDGGVTTTDVDLSQAKGEELWQAVIPAKDSIATGSIYFEITNLSGVTLTTGNYTIKFLVDEWDPILEKVVGNIVQVNNPANVSLAISDHSGITSCTGYFSKDGFITETEIVFSSSKNEYINLYNLIGIVPAESELTDGEIKFTIVDNGGNTINSSIYPVKWISSIPKSFDLRTSLDKSYVTPVKEQFSGTCWTFGAFSAVESNLLKTGLWEASGEIGEPDLSENHLSRWCGFNQFFNGDINPSTGDGLEVHNRGDYLVTSAYMSRGEGAIRDIDASDFTVVPDRFSDSYHYYYAKDIEWHSMDAQLNGIDLIKQTIIENGVVGTSLCYSYDFMPANDFFHYQPADQPWYITHAVSIVGWDDEKTSSSVSTPGPGAWLCKNSWGDEWGLDGYFWASYYDKFIGRDPEGAMSFQNVEPMKYDKIYYHDYHGWSDTMVETDEAFNAFTTEKQEDLVAVSFFTAKDNVDYTVTVYDDFNGAELQNILSTTSGHIDYKGFHTIDLPSIVTIPNADDFYVYVYFSNGGHAYDQSSVTPTSSWLPYQSSASAGESYYKSGGIWMDLYDNITITKPQTANFCIKGLCDDDTGIDQDINSIRTFELEQNYPNPFNPNTIINFSVPENDSKLKLAVYNVNGQLVSTLFDGIKNSGRHSINFNASALNSGVYYYTLEVDGVKQSTKKMVMIK
ncbi:MAG: lectin like domain-containing protein [Candidatus Delongbacteria bacterium]|nr:lectin like domain-containing protein [Candidatus Delongbacteria bacterium]